MGRGLDAEINNMEWVGLDKKDWRQLLEGLCLIMKFLKNKKGEPTHSVPCLDHCMKSHTIADGTLPSDPKVVGQTASLLGYVSWTGRRARDPNYKSLMCTWSKLQILMCT